MHIMDGSRSGLTTASTFVVQASGSGLISRALAGIIRTLIGAVLLSALSSVAVLAYKGGASQHFSRILTAPQCR